MKLTKKNASKIETLEKKLNESIEKNVELSKIGNKYKAAEILDEASKDLTDTAKISIREDVIIFAGNHTILCIVLLWCLGAYFCDTFSGHCISYGIF